MARTISTMMTNASLYDIYFENVDMTEKFRVMFDGADDDKRFVLTSMMITWA